MSENPKVRYALIVLAGIIILSSSYFDFSLPREDSVLDNEALYRGTTVGSVIDPKEYYEKLTGLTTSTDDSMCKTTIEFKPNLIRVSGSSNFYLPIDTKETITNVSSFIGKDGSSLFKEKSEILMPCQGTRFKNSNMVNSSLDSSTKAHNIELISGDKIIIVFEDVMCWWCHKHNPSDTVKHDKYVGNSPSSSIKSVDQVGAVIGIAKSTTKLKIYEVIGDVKADDVDSLNQLKQIDSGKYMSTGVIEYV